MRAVDGLGAEQRVVEGQDEQGLRLGHRPIVADIRHDWSVAEAEALFVLPFNDPLFRAQTIHRAHFPANQVQLSTLLSIKTGGCPEDCAYCPQAARYDTGVEAQKLMAVE